MELIHESVKMYSAEYEYEFEITGKHCGFAFPCNEVGTIVLDTLSPAAIENLKRCKSGKITFYQPPHKTMNVSAYMMPAEGKCSCGEIVCLTDDYYGACQCGNCGKWYSLTGQELNPPDQWEEPLEDDY